MKYTNKYVCCNREATKKFKSRYFCDDCLKMVRKRNPKYVLAEKYIFNMLGLKVYTDIPVKLK